MIGQTASYSSPHWFYFQIWQWDAEFRYWRRDLNPGMLQTTAVPLSPTNFDPFFYASPPYKVFQTHVYQGEGDGWTLVTQRQNWDGVTP